MVVLPQPDGPTNTATSPAPSAKLKSASTSCRSPTAFVNALRAISTSTCTGSTPRYAGCERPYQGGFDGVHHRRESHRIGKQTGDVEQREGDADREANAIRAPEQSGTLE